MFARFLSFWLSSGLILAASAPTFPVLTYSTYLRDNFTPKAIATDSHGNIYLAGNAIINAGTGSGQTTALIAKLNPQASQFLYLRYLGGSVADFATAVAVDSSGYAYIAGYTQSPDFPVTGGANLGTPPGLGAQSGQRSWVAKLDPGGEMVFSELLGGSASSAAQAVAVNPAGQIFVTGTATTFPATPGAYNNAKSGFYLLELDPTGMNLVFAAAGIGGSAIVLDTSGNIYVAGSTTSLSYPTTAGAYQTTFPAVMNCGSPDCAFPFPGSNQYVTKVDPTGSKLIYSTAVTGTRNTGNAGLAVDQAGNAYVTGFAGATYPYTVPVPPVPVEQAPFYETLPFLSKLDPGGQTLLFSVPVGGAGVQLDSDGAVYVGGYVGAGSSIVGVLPNIPALANVPGKCLPIAGPTAYRVSAYAAEVDGASGNLLGTQFIGGSSLTPGSVALFGSTLWIAGAATYQDFPFTPNALTVSSFGLGPRAGAYLGSVDFSQTQPPAGPQISCIESAADMSAAGPAARNEVLTIWGSGLGPAQGVAATDYSTTTLGGSGVIIGGVAAPLLYASSTQINVAMPMLLFSQSLAAIGLTVNGVSAPPVGLPLTVANPTLFPVVLNGDGSLNSSTNPAGLGSAVSVFVNGLSGLIPDFQENTNIPGQLYTVEGWSVTNIVAATPFVLRVDLQLPGKYPGVGGCQCATTLGFTLYNVNNNVPGFPPAENISGVAFGGFVYVALP